MISLVIHFRIWLRKTERLVSVRAFSGFGLVVGGGVKKSHVNILHAPAKTNLKYICKVMDTLADRRREMNA